LKFAAVTLIGFLAPFGIALFLEQRSRRVRESAQIQQHADVTIIGEVTSSSGQRFRHGRPVPSKRHRSRQVFDESIDALRTRLMLSDDFGHLQVLAVASAVSGEGKTRLAAHLAMSLARSTGKRTLLIEADVRAPQLYKRFDIAHGIGLVDVLTGQCPADEAIVTNVTRHFDVLPAGKLPANPHALFGGEQFARFMDELKRIYRYIVIDTPPLLAASEALVLAKCADGVLLCTMQDVSCTPQVKLARERLQASGANVIGAVLNGVPTRRYLSLYGDYRYPPVADYEEPATVSQDLGTETDVSEPVSSALCRPK
jgi:capsular exopolysaccharide synthesis family protein